MDQAWLLPSEDKGHRSDLPKSIPEGRDALRARGACPQSTEGRQSKYIGNGMELDGEKLSNSGFDFCWCQVSAV